jgi:hypothetical protein
MMQMPTRQELLQSYASRFIRAADTDAEIEKQFDECLELNALSWTFENGKWQVHLCVPVRARPVTRRRQ